MADWIGMLFRIVSWIVPRNHKLDSGACCPTRRDNFGVDMGQTIVTNGENAASAIPAVQPVTKLHWDFLSLVAVTAAKWLLCNISILQISD